MRHDKSVKGDGFEEKKGTFGRKNINYLHVCKKSSTFAD